jgi:hypothetical protein
MTNFKITNVITSEEVVLETKKSVADFITAANITDNSVKTIEKKISKAIKTGEVLYETFKIEEIKEEENMKNHEENILEGLNEFVAQEVEPQSEFVKDENAGQVAVLNDENEVVYDNPAELQVPSVNEVEQQTEDTPVENKDDVIEDAAVPTIEEIEEVPVVEDEHVAEEQTEEKKGHKGKKEKSEKDDEQKENKRRVGKGVIAYKNGEEFMRFPSIKATAQHFKEMLGIKHMPFTPIMKSIRMGIDWNEYSFKHENDEDLYIPEPLKKKIEESKKQSQETPVVENKDEQPTAQQDEVIEEIVEEIVEEEIKEAQ